MLDIVHYKHWKLW